MKKKLKVYYTIQYVKEIELELDEKLCEGFNKGNKIKLYHSEWIDKEDNYKKLKELPIPEIYEDCGGDIRSIEYVDNSFEINYFEE